MPRVLSLTTLALVAVSTSGCFLWTSREQGKQLEADMAHLKDQVAQLDTELEADREKLTEMIEHARSEMAQLEETLTRATRVLARNSADFGAEMETAKDHMREVDGTLAELGHRVEQLGGQVERSDRRVEEFALAAGLDLPVDEAKVPDNAAEHFAQAKASLEAERYGEVRALAKLFIERYPKDDDADDAQLLIARSYLEQNRWAKALGALRRFTDVHPKSELTAEVLYEMANAFFQLGDCTDARILVEAVTTRHAKSPFAAKARQLGQQMNQQKSKCTS